MTRLMLAINYISNPYSPQASKAFHMVYIAASMLIDIKQGREGRNSDRSSCSEPLRLFGLHMAAVIISCINFFVETVRNRFKRVRCQSLDV